jgi:peptidoglycan/xylan/chitin deacetylase (PgdA/CDA1 family)
MKRLIKKFLVQLSFLDFTFKGPQSVQNIYYHDVVSESGSSFDKIEWKHFKEQMEYLYQNGYESILMSEWETSRAEGKEKVVLITFDDGYKSNYSYVFPLMKELNMKFNVFLEAGSCGKNDYMSWEMIREMSKSGQVEFGAHTYTHKDTRYIRNKEEVEKEIHKADQLISDCTGKKVEDFCFPYGMYNSKSIRMLGSYGQYRRIYTSDGRKAKKQDGLWLIGRVGVENEDSIETFTAKATGKYNFYYRSLKFFKNVLRVGKNEVYREHQL